MVLVFSPLPALSLIVHDVQSSHQPFTAVRAFVKAGVRMERPLILQEVPVERSS